MFRVCLFRGIQHPQTLDEIKQNILYLLEKNFNRYLVKRNQLANDFIVFSCLPVSTFISQKLFSVLNAVRQVKS